MKYCEQSLSHILPFLYKGRAYYYNPEPIDLAATTRLLIGMLFQAIAVVIDYYSFCMVRYRRNLVNSGSQPYWHLNSSPLGLFF